MRLGDEGGKMRIVYLDQNHWIHLARSVYDQPGAAAPPEVVASLRAAQRSGQACFPLSLAHYIETQRQATADRRSRLSRVMLDLSAGWTVVPPHVVLLREIEEALQKRFPGRVTLEPFRYLGRGLSHAADHDFDLDLPWPAEAAVIPADVRVVIERTFRMAATQAVLSGVVPGEQPVRGAVQDADRRFKANLEKLSGTAGQHSLPELERRIYANTLADIEQPVRQALVRHGIAMDEFAALDEEGLRSFLDDLPSRRVDMHLNLQWAKNRALRAKDTHLNDWAYLGTAVVRCDVVVTDKEMADLLGRGLHPRARVLSKLSDLTPLLAPAPPARA
jgi:hypothetical protein